MLLFKAGAGGLKAVELSQVTRLERVPAADIEHAGGEAVLQLRGELVPVLTLDGARAPLAACVHIQPLIILSDQDGAVALAVEEIVDVVEDRLDIELMVDEPGVLGAAVIGGAAVQVLDLDWCLSRARPRRRLSQAASSGSRAAA